MTRLAAPAVLLLSAVLSAALASPLPLVLGVAAVVVLGSELLTDTALGS